MTKMQTSTEKKQQSTVGKMRWHLTANKETAHDKFVPEYDSNWEDTKKKIP
jgi:hypothetical protein